MGVWENSRRLGICVGHSSFGRFSRELHLESPLKVRFSRLKWGLTGPSHTHTLYLKELYASLRINVQFLKYMCDRAAAIFLIGA